jgi:hypothetical protein
MSRADDLAADARRRAHELMSKTKQQDAERLSARDKLRQADAAKTANSPARQNAKCKRSPEAAPSTIGSRARCFPTSQPLQIDQGSVADPGTRQASLLLLLTRAVAPRFRDFRQTLDRPAVVGRRRRVSRKAATNGAVSVRRRG